MITSNTTIPRVKGLTVMESEERDEVYYYTNASMIQERIFIDLAFFDVVPPVGAEFASETWITVTHLSDIDSLSYTLYQGEYLAPIQSYRMIKDIHELYLDSSLKEFLQVLHGMSVSFKSASMQSKESNRQRIMDDTRADFAMVKEMFNEGMEE